ncbi:MULTISPECIES: hypothetical protein [unclassified Sinorhizobium]|uniref:hypothetical protein n=1 Tax=unclassified Sinorhizobium TaxID=2613772 RepID=UPI0035254DA0
MSRLIVDLLHPSDSFPSASGEINRSNCCVIRYLGFILKGGGQLLLDADTDWGKVRIVWRRGPLGSGSSLNRPNG